MPDGTAGQRTANSSWGWWAPSSWWSAPSSLWWWVASSWSSAADGWWWAEWSTWWRWWIVVGELSEPMAMPAATAMAATTTKPRMATTIHSALLLPPDDGGSPGVVPSGGGPPGGPAGGAPGGGTVGVTSVGGTAATGSVGGMASAPAPGGTASTGCVAGGSAGGVGWPGRGWAFGSPGSDGGVVDMCVPLCAGPRPRSALARVEGRRLWFPDPDAENAEGPDPGAPGSGPQGGGGENRTHVQGFAGPCLSHSATPPGRATIAPSRHWPIRRSQSKRRGCRCSAISGSGKR